MISMCRSSIGTLIHVGACLIALALILPVSVVAQNPPAASPAGGGGQAFKQEELDAILAPIALYPDSLLSQVLMASTYPLEIVEASRWAEQNKGLKGDALQSALQAQKWDESVKSLCAFPEVLDRMNKDLAWTQKLGDAFLGDQKRVMDTVQSLRQKAQANDSLKTNEQQKVVVENNYITIEPANPQVIYVPTYQPTVVYGAWPYPAYPPYYPPYWATPGAAFVRGVAWGAGVAAGAALWGGFNWNHGDVNINVNRYNNFNRTNIQNNNWQHNAAHREGVPYRDSAARQKYGNYDRQAAQAREQFRGREGSLGGGGLNDRTGLQSAANPGVGGRESGQLGGANRDLAANRGGSGGSLSANRGGGGGDFGANRGRAGGSANLGANRGSGGGGGGGGFNVSNGAQTRDFSNRGNASMGNRSFSGGGGGARAGGGGGGARGDGARGGGGGHGGRR
jgi:Protein of unknown function (DUF3300)